ncbi:hypothetical protein AXF42_Ash012392 [Apostasia shenzhenica]|uniref:Homeobox domain-containing protein n=1 Tax=Apostasia shenzhenica TaxID=1088818 RepID=A0A2I0AD27_9ASPA|nr:hypothetical protein AXF42_Ash012392 [Apostasia shenzhenica]
MFDWISAIEELSGIPSKGITKLLKGTDNFTIQFNDSRGCLRQIDIEGLAASLPLHLISVLLSNGWDECLLHVLRGVRLLCTFSDLATRHSKLEQILLDDVKLSEQVLDLVIFLLIILAQSDQGNHDGGSFPVLHAALVTCSFHLLAGYISLQWQDVANVLLAHPKVDIFMDVAFDAVQATVRLLQVRLSILSRENLYYSFRLSSAEKSASFVCQQCEVSLQSLLSFCQHKLFRDRLLKNKELCKNGGILSLTCAILKLSIPNCFKESVDIVAAISRLKSRILSILLQLCEAENFSYLDEVASSQKSLHLAKSVTVEILALLKAGFKNEAVQNGDSVGKRYPKGLLLLNSLRLADIFSDDSNFRSFFMANAIHVFNEILAVPHQVFLSNWCNVDVPVTEEDANLDYDPFAAVSMAFIINTSSLECVSAADLSNEINFSFHSNFNGMHTVSYAQQRTSYLVKILANLHCFVPSFCEEEEQNLFLKRFHGCLLMENPDTFSKHAVNVNTHKAATICENLSSLSNYAASLIPQLLNDEDLQLLRVFTEQLKKLTLPNADAYAQAPFQRECGKMTLEDQSYVHHSLPSWTKFSNGNFNKNYQDVRSTGGAMSSVLVKDELKAQDDILGSKDNIDMKGGTPHSLSLAELDSLVGTAMLYCFISVIYDEGGGSSTLKSFLHGILVKDFVNLVLTLFNIFEATDLAKENGFQEEEKAEGIHSEEKQPKKRKRNIMNERQISLIENALLDEPEMQRNAALLQSWSERLCSQLMLPQGSEITASQLKNWLNNRKARLARAAREARAPSEGENNYDSAGEEPHTVGNSRAIGTQPDPLSDPRPPQREGGDGQTGA